MKAVTSKSCASVCPSWIFWVIFKQSALYALGRDFVELLRFPLSLMNILIISSIHWTTRMQPISVWIDRRIRQISICTIFLLGAFKEWNIPNKSHHDCSTGPYKSIINVKPLQKRHCRMCVEFCTLFKTCDCVAWWTFREYWCLSSGRLSGLWPSSMD